MGAPPCEHLAGRAWGRAYWKTLRGLARASTGEKQPPQNGAPLRAPGAAGKCATPWAWTQPGLPGT
eukprot:11174387-Lingulodinium_polyedra.AAC.1